MGSVSRLLRRAAELISKIRVPVSGSAEIHLSRSSHFVLTCTLYFRLRIIP
jgi:hypothetical protein